MKNYTEKSNNPITNKRVKILLVDDRSENLLALEAVLECPEYHLISVNSGMEALKQVFTEDFAVILLDVQMPDIDGFETAKLIKIREKSKHTPIIFITAMNQAAEHVSKGYSVGAVEYIFKPFLPETLKSKVEAFVRIHQFQEQIKCQNELLLNRAVELEMLNNKLFRISSELRKTEALASAIGETSSDTIVTFNESGHIVTVNPAVFSMFNYNAFELEGSSIQTILPKYNDQWQGHSGRVIETVAVRKNQTLFPSDIQIGEASVEGQRIWVCSIRDITERKQMEEERFRKIFESSPCLIEIRSLIDRRYINVNKSWLQYTGYHYDEVVNRSSDVIHYVIDIHAEEQEVEKWNMEKLIHNARISYLTKFAELREGLLSTEFIEIHGEKCILSVITDITERVVFEKEIARLDRLNIIGEMAAGIAHEIRNPMTTIRGFLQMSKSKLSMEYVDIMVEELDRANNIITEFLTISKIQTTNRKLQQLGSIIESIFPLIQASAMLADKSVHLELEECPLLYVDEKEIRQLILNLSLNGLEAMYSGGKLTIKTYTKDLETVLEIADMGHGIKKEVLEKLGTAFFSTKEHGTGLGLSICYGVASRHHAKIDVETSNQGTTFLVRFPSSRSDSSNN